MRIRGGDGDDGIGIDDPPFQEVDQFGALVVLELLLREILGSRKPDVVEVPDGASPLIGGIVDREDDRPDRKNEEVAGQDGCGSHVPVVEVEDVDRFSLEFQVFEDGPREVEESGRIVFAPIDFVSVEVARRVARLEQPDWHSFAIGRPHGVGVEAPFLKAFEIGDLQVDMAEPLEADEIVFREDDIYVLADPLELAGKAEHDLPEPPRLGDRSALRRNLNDPHDLSLKPDSET